MSLKYDALQQETQLQREVAIKLLPRSLAKDPERLSRFARVAPFPRSGN